MVALMVTKMVADKVADMVADVVAVMDVDKETCLLYTSDAADE